MWATLTGDYGNSILSLTGLWAATGTLKLDHIRALSTHKMSIEISCDGFCFIFGSALMDANAFRDRYAPVFDTRTL